MKLESYPMTHNPPLANDYIEHADKLAARVDYLLQDESAWQSRALWLDETGHRRADRKQLAEVLKSYNAHIHNSERAMQHIEQLENERALVIVGGQQAGLFTGPLLVIYKAIACIQQAKKASVLLNRPVVPVFWIAGEDHDIEEVNHIYYASSEWTVEKLQLPYDGGESPRIPVSHFRLTAQQWESVLAQLENALIDSDFKPDMMAKLRDIAAKSETLSEAFARMMAWLFADYGLVLLDSADPKLRRLEAPMFSWMIRHADQLNDQFIKGSAAIKALGYDVQAPAASGQANLFYVGENARVLLYKDGDLFTDRLQTERFSMQDLIDIAERQPERLSNNVLTRPMMQDYLFPVLGVVLGGSETAYWAQLREAFHYAEMKMPLIVPRARYTLLEGTLQKLFRKFEWSFEDVYHHWRDKREQWLKAQDELNLDRQFDIVRKQFSEIYDPLLDKVEQVHPGLKKLTSKNKQKIEEQIAFMQKRASEAYESLHIASLRQMERLSASIKPMDLPQERVYNIVAYLNKYGTDWLKQLTELTVDRPEYHHIVSL